MNDLKIFIVEDDIVYLNLFEKYLLSIGFDNVIAFDKASLSPFIIPFSNFILDYCN